MSTPDWKRTASLGANASLGTAEAAAMREQLARRKAAREAEEHPAPRPAGAYDELQTAALLSLDARLRQLEASASGMDLLLQDSGGGGGAHPFKVIDASDASDANGPKVRVSPGTVSAARWPTIGGVSIATEPPPTLSTPETGWIVMTSTWADDHVPRRLPLSVAIVFQAGDIAADYVPPAADSRTTARLVTGSVKVANGAITAATSFLSWHIVMTRVVYGNAAEHVKFDALRL